MKTRVVLYCLLGGLPLTVAALEKGQFTWWWLGGIALAAGFVPVALFGPRSPLGQFAVLAPIVSIVTALCTWSEALIFVPALRQHAASNLMGVLVTYLIIVAVLAALAWGLKLPRPLSGQPVPRRPPSSALAMILVCGVAYLLFYFVFGAITYQFFTKGYYPEAADMARSLGLWFWAIQIARGALMTAAVVPAIYTLRMSRWQVAIATGMMIWIAGGLSPLLLPNPMLGPAQRIIHTVEILTQNLPLGILAGLLLRPRSAAMPSPAGSETAGLRSAAI